MMEKSLLRAILTVLSLLGAPIQAADEASAQSPASASESLHGLAGLWVARRNFNSGMSGELLIRKSGDRLFAEIAGAQAPVSLLENQLRFELPSGGFFEGQVLENGDAAGHWHQMRSPFDGSIYTNPLYLKSTEFGWKGQQTPQADTATFYLILKQNEGRLNAELINPERNLGLFTQLSHLVLNGKQVTLMGSFRGRGPDRPMLKGAYHSDEDVLALRYPSRGGAYEFHRATPEQAVGFMPRSNGAALLLQPPRLDDGWETASLSEAGIDPNQIRRFIEAEVMVTPSSTHDLSIHAILIARHGKLVLEEYFHAYHRDLPHDSRSASKSVTAMLAAAIMHDNAGLEWGTPVYSSLGEQALLDREPRRGQITLQHLLNMASGLDCDDRNPDSAANEDYLWDHVDEINFYQHTLKVKMPFEPNERPMYCSAGAHLAGAVMAVVAEKSLLELIEDKLAVPLNIDHYSVPTTPDGDPFMGGGIRWRPRDFLKFPQVILDQGEWQGVRIMSPENARRLITPQVKIDGGRDYGYLWWTIDYPWKGKTVRAHFMGGNGGQIAMLIPDLQLSIVFQAGNYSDRVGFRIQNELIPEFILPAIDALVAD